MITTRAVTIFCVALLIAQKPYAVAQPPAATGSQSQAASFSAEQLDSLVAPIALYPDPILSQMLVASTYPLEVVEAGRWLRQNSNLSGKALADAVAQQPWDASVQALVLVPEALNRLDQDVSWTSTLGNAFLAQQADVMDAIQRMRKRASDRGVLQTTSQQTVYTTAANGQTDIEIQPASPQIVYVPEYNPVAVWGPSPAYYPYPALYYPPISTGALIGASVISFGAGIVVGAILSGGWSNWGWRSGWGHRNVVINNNFVSSNRFNHVAVAGDNGWIHNPAHRGGVPYGSPAVASRFQGAGNPVPARPTVGQTQQRLSQPGFANRGGLPGQPGPGNFANRAGQPQLPAGAGQQGSAQRLTPGNPAFGARGANPPQPGTPPSQPGITPQHGMGSAQRLAPGNPAFGARGANPVQPRAVSPQFRMPPPNAGGRNLPSFGPQGGFRGGGFHGGGRRR